MAWVSIISQFLIHRKYVLGGYVHWSLSHALLLSPFHDTSMILPWGRNIILLPCNYLAAWGQANIAWNLQRSKLIFILMCLVIYFLTLIKTGWTQCHTSCVGFLCVCGYTVGWCHTCGLLTTSIFPCFQSIGHLDYHYFLKIPEEFIRFSWTHLEIYFWTLMTGILLKFKFLLQLGATVASSSYNMIS